MINKEEALVCMNRFINQLHVDDILDLNNTNIDKKVEDVKEYLLDRYYQEDNRLIHQNMVELLKLFLSLCNIQDSISEGSYGEKELCFMDTLISPYMAELIEKAKKVYFPECYDEEVEGIDE